MSNKRFDPGLEKSPGPFFVTTTHRHPQFINSIIREKKDSKIREGFHDGCRMAVLGEGTQSILRGPAFGLPIEHTATDAVRVVLRLTQDTEQLALAFCYHLGSRLIDLETRFGNHDGTPVDLAHPLDVFDAIGDGRVSLACTVGLMCPVGIERHANHVPLGAIFLQAAEVPVVKSGVPSVVQMNDADCLGGKPFSWHHNRR